MKKLFEIALAFGFFAIVWPSLGLGYELKLINTSSHDLSNYPVVIEVKKLPVKLRESDLVLRDARGDRLLSQLDDLDGDGVADEMAFLVHAAPHSSITVSLKTNPSPDRGQVSDESLAWRLWNWANLENASLCWNIPPIFDGDDAYAFSPDAPAPFIANDILEIQDKDRDKVLLEFSLASSADYLADDRGQRVVSGPVRSMTMRSRSVGIERAGERKFRIDETFTLYETRRRADLTIAFTNLSDSAQKVPSGLRIFDGRMGELLTDDLGSVEKIRDVLMGVARSRVTPNMLKSNRSHVLWLNPSTGYSMAYIPHTPDPSGWSSEAIGQDYIRFAAGPGGKIRLSGGIADKLDPGQTSKFTFSFVFYRGDRKRVIDEYVRDIDGVAGVVTVLDADCRPLRIAQQPLYFAETFSNSERWLADKGVSLRISDNTAKIETGETGNGMYTFFARDFSSPTELRASIDPLSANTALKVDIEHPDSGKKYAVGTFSDRFKVSLSEVLPFTKLERCVLRLTPVSTKSPDKEIAVRVNDLSLGWPVPETPDLVWPRDGQNLSDVGVSFTIISPAHEQGYMLQVARDKDFGDLVLTDKVPKDTISKEADVTKHVPSRPLGLGTYWWRVRPVGPSGERGRWTEPKHFVVDSTDHPRRPPIRPISSRNPVLFITGFGKGDDRLALKQELEAMPEAVRNLFVEQRGFDPDGEYPLPAFLHNDHEVDLPQLELAYRTSPQVLGFVFREKGMGDEYLEPVIKLSAKYGRYVSTLQVERDMMVRSVLSEELYPLMAEYGDYFLPQNKMNNRRDQLPKILTEVGAYLTGRVGNWGIETEWGYAWKPMSWQRKMKPEMITTPLNWMQTMVFGVATGASLYRVEGFCNPKYCHAFHRSKPHQFGPLWTRGLGPLFEDILRYDLIPTREQMLDRTKVALATKPEYGLHRPSTPDSQYPAGKVIAALHGLQTEGVPSQFLFEANWIPNASESYMIPLLPPYLKRAERNLFTEVITAEQFSSTQDAVLHVSQVYGPNISEAYAVLVGDTGIVINSIDERRDPRSGPQQFMLNLSKGPVASISGRLGYQAYLIAKQMPDSLFIHSNNFQEQYTTISLKSKSGTTLSVAVTPSDALAKRTWKEAPGELDLTLNHFHGVARAIFKTGGKDDIRKYSGKQKSIEGARTASATHHVERDVSDLRKDTVLLIAGYPDSAEWLTAEVLRRVGAEYEKRHPDVKVRFKPGISWAQGRQMVLEGKACGIMISEKINKVRAYYAQTGPSRGFNTLKLDKFIPIAKRIIRSEDRILGEFRLGIAADKISQELANFLEFLSTEKAKKAIRGVPYTEPVDRLEKPQAIDKIFYNYKEVSLDQPVLSY